MDNNFEVATFGGGCFWGVEDVFMSIPGVIETEVGYEGGDYDNPTYEDVSYKRTGHAEVVRVKFDPAQVHYQDLVDVFFRVHNPTTLNQQGPDVGEQYRSVIFYNSPKQREVAEITKEELEVSGKFADPIVTQIVPEKTFYRAEEYHQKYHQKNGGSCAI